MRNPSFWRNLTLIALGHAALITGLIRWSHGSKNLEPQSVVWLNSGGAGDGDTAKTVPKTSAPTSEAKQLKHEEPDRDRPILTSTKSEIQLPSATPKPTATPKSSVTSKPTPKLTPKPKLKAVLAKAAPKPSSKVKTAKSGGNREKVDPKKKRIAKGSLDDKQGKASHHGSGKGTSIGAGGKTNGAGAAAQFGWYGNMLHDRFHSAWIQPTTATPTGDRISVLVKVRIEQDGSVSQFQVVKPSGNIVVDESVSAVSKRVTQVDPLPDGLGSA
ncbi:MAG: TonB C-terminal domain-containing protein, partial [Chthoniobacterales bacterium]